MNIPQSRQIRAQRALLLRRACRHLELINKWPPPHFTGAPKAFRILHGALASKLIDQAQALTRQLHPEREFSRDWSPL